MKKLVKYFSFRQQPHDLYVSNLLMELVTLTRSTIKILQHEEVAKRRLRHAINFLFRSYIAFENAFKEWAKNAKMREPAHIQGIFQSELTAKLIDRHLTEAIPEIEKMLKTNVLNRS